MRLVVLTALLAACGASPTSYCRKAVDCVEKSGGEVSDEELDQCVELLEDIGEIYDDAGCSKEYRSLLGCLQRSATCEEDGELTSEASSCSSEEDELLECAA